MGGGALLVKNHTLANLLSRVYSDFHWENPLSQHTDIWKDENCAGYFVEWLKKQPETEIFYSHKVVEEMGYKQSFPLVQMLKTSFPKYNFLPTTAKKSQYVLKECLDELELDSELVEKYKPPQIPNLELDYFYPKLNLAFEFQV